MAKSVTVTTTRSILVTPAVTADAHTAGDVLGGLMTIPGACHLPDRGGVIHAAVMTSDIDIPATTTIDVLFFGANPTNSTFTDSAALAVNVADLHFLLGVIQLETRVDCGTPAIIQSTGISLPFEVTTRGTDSLYAVAVVRTATYTPVGTSDVNFCFHVLQD